MADTSSESQLQPAVTEMSFCHVVIGPDFLSRRFPLPLLVLFDARFVAGFERG
jgi:hypothetical protein